MSPAHTYLLESNAESEADPEANLADDLNYLIVLQRTRLTSEILQSGWRKQLRHISSLPPLPLDDDIHPLFRRKRWPSMKPEDYDLLLPALKIATKFMKEPLLMGWWRHTLFGEVVLNKHSRRYLTCNHLENSDRANKRLRVLLEKDIPTVLEFQFHNLDQKGSRIDGCAFGSHAAYMEFRSGIEGTTPRLPIFDKPRIVLHIQYLFSLRYLVLYGSARELENVHLRIAITLCHELAHVVWRYRVNKQIAIFPTAGIESTEPLHHETEHLAELGSSWEFFVFGGCIWTMDRPGWFTTFYRPRSSESNPSVTQRCIVVPQWWISMWSRKQVWDAFNDLYTRGELRLPNECESGYSLCGNSRFWSVHWVLYRRKIPLSLYCRTPEASVFYLWHKVRPRLQRVLVELQEEAELSREDEAEVDRTSEISAMDKLWSELCELLVSPELIDSASPKGLLSED